MADLKMVYEKDAPIDPLSIAQRPECLSESLALGFEHIRRLSVELEHVEVMRDGKPGANLAREPRRLASVHVARHTPLGFTAVDGHEDDIGMPRREGGRKSVVQPRIAAVIQRQSIHANDKPQTPAVSTLVELNLVVRRRHGGDRCAAERDGLPRVNRNDPSR